MKRIYFALSLACLTAFVLLMGEGSASVTAESALDNPVISDLFDDLETEYGNNHVKPPIVLVHGWQGANIGLECQRHPLSYHDENWADVDEELAALGFDV